MKRNKKASLSLSINAIVILVLAITMLGLGLGFTKGMFSKFASKLEVPPPNIPATPEEPIVLPDESIEILKNKPFEFTVNFYNDGTGGRIYPYFECSGALLKLSTPGFDASGKTNLASATATGEALSQNVDSGTFKSFKFLMPRPDVAGKSICTLSFSNKSAVLAPIGGVDKQITIISK